MITNIRLWAILFVVTGTLVACGAESVEVTRIVTQYNNVEVEATREVEVDVTRLVEVAAEVEVTRKVEVTRIVEQPVEIDEQLPVVYSGEFPRLAFDTVMPTGQSVAVECQDSNADYPYSPYDWPDATAMLEIRQGASRSTVAMEVSAARPNTYYTTWLRLKGEDANGVAYGGNPLMGIPGTPLIPSSELDNALETFSEPDDTSINGFYTDENGNASFYIELDFPIINGAYPFQGFAGFDAADERFLLDEPSIPPVAIAMSGVPFTLRIASHCMDGKGHGLMPGPHEGWFDWTLS